MRNSLSDLLQSAFITNPVVLALFLANFSFNVIANSGFKLSAQSHNLRSFLAWQVVGNLAGFITVLTLTGLLRHIPLHVAFPATTGLAIIGVQVIGARWIFDEAISLEHWLGTGLIFAGVWLISIR